MVWYWELEHGYSVVCRNVERDTVAGTKGVVPLLRLVHRRWRTSRWRVPASKIEGVIVGWEWRKHKFDKSPPASAWTLTAVEFKTPFLDIYKKEYIRRQKQEITIDPGRGVTILYPAWGVYIADQTGDSMYTYHLEHSGFPIIQIESVIRYIVDKAITTDPYA